MPQGNCGRGGEAEIADEDPGPALPGAASRYGAVVLLGAVGALLPLVLPGPDWLTGPVDWPRVGLLAVLNVCWGALAQGGPTPACGCSGPRCSAAVGRPRRRRPRNGPARSFCRCCSPGC
ncbi:hypothetical protein ACFQ0T_15280 [Kitasatospora gansuensis]